MFSLWWVTASAAETCEPLGETELAELVQAVDRDLEADDPIGLARHIDLLLSRVPCLDHVPGRQSWATVLVELAVLRHLQGGDWQTPLATALQLDPGVDRRVGPSHEMALWTPPPVDTSGEAVPEGYTLFVDGIETRHLPAADGLHLVQLRQGDDGLLVSLLLESTRFPAELLKETPEPPVKRAPLALLGHLSAGVAAQDQDVQPSGDYAHDQSSLDPELAAGLGAVVRGTGGAELGLLLGQDLEGVLAVGLGSRHVRLGPAVAASRHQHQEGEEVRSALLVTPALSAALWLGREQGSTWDVAAMGGLGPSSRLGVARVGFSPGQGGALRWRAGLELRARQGLYVQPLPDDTRSLVSTHAALLAQVGAIWGSW